MKVKYIEHGNLQLLQRDVNAYLSEGTWRLDGPVNHLNGRWVQGLIQGVAK